MNVTTDYFFAEDGTKIYYESYVPEVYDKAVVIVHGYSEYIGRYKELISFLYDHNIAVYGMDARGHGDSEGIRAHVNCWSEYTSDLHRFISKITCDKELIMFAHSMGTIIATNYLVEYGWENISALILSGTAIKTDNATKWYMIMLAKALSKIAPKLSIDLKFNADYSCSDPAVNEKAKQDPKMFGTATPRWGTEMLKAIERTKRHTEIYTKPLLMLHGAKDRITDYQAAKAFFEQIKSKDKKFISYPNSYHEVLYDVDKEKVYADILKFIQEH